MNGNSTVDRDMAERVRTAVRKLRYQPDRVARRMRSAQAAMWALIVPDIENPFFTRIARGVEDIARDVGICVFLGNSDQDEQKERQYVQTALAERVGGVIISPASPVASVGLLQAAATPVVVIDSELSGGDFETVVSDNYSGGRMAADELLRCGYRRLACIVGPVREERWNDRLRGFESAVRASREAASIVAIERSDNRLEGGAYAADAILDSHPEVDGLFVSNNMMTFGAARKIVGRGMSLGSDIGLVGFDVDSVSDGAIASLTSIDQDARRIGRLAGSYLAADPQSRPSRPRVTLLPPQLTLGASTIRHR